MSTAVNSAAGKVPHVLVVGGGITGLSAAWTLQRMGNVRITLIEASERWGGKIHTVRPDGYTLELGADALLLRKPWARLLATELGLDQRVQPVNRPPVSTYVLHRGKPIPLPDGLPLLVPTKWGPFLRSPLFSPWGKLRAACDLFLPARNNPEDESLASFVTRRLGREMLERVADPMLAGVLNAEADRLSMQATFPQFPQLEKTYSSLIRGVRAKRAESAASDAAPFFSFPDGLQEMVDELVQQLRCQMHLSIKLDGLEPISDSAYRAITSSMEIAADAVILTTPARVSAQALRAMCPAAADELGSIRYSGIGTAYLAFEHHQVPHSLDGYGVVIPAREGRSIDGMTWSSTKWSGRCPDGQVLIRVFFGGPHSRPSMALDDQRRIETIRQELASILNIRAAPTMTYIHRWYDGYPQYDMGHLERVGRIEAALPPRIVVAGCAYRGVGVPDCVRQGSDAANRVMELLNKPTQDQYDHNPFPAAL